MEKEIKKFDGIVEGNNPHLATIRMDISDTINSSIIEKIKIGLDRVKEIKSPNIIDMINCTSLNLADRVSYIELAAEIANHKQDPMDRRYYNGIAYDMRDANETVRDMYVLYMVELFLTDQFSTLYSRIEYEFEWFDNELKSKIKNIAISLPRKILININKYFDIDAIRYYWQSMIINTDSEDDRRDKLESAILPSLNLFVTDTMAGISMVICDTVYAHFVTEISGSDFDLILKGLSPFLSDFRDELLDFTFAVVRDLVLYRATVDKDINERVQSLASQLLGDNYEDTYYPL